MFIDSATIFVQSGRGGDGCVSFRREKYVPKGGPDGGDGGNGGDVILLADPAVATLLDFAGRHHWRASNGQPGSGRQRHGRSGEDLPVPLALGTMAYDDDSGQLLVDLNRAGQRVVIAAGGRGGFGNEHFKGQTRQSPRQATAGGPAIEKKLRLELKLIADIGLVGKPNAGKSTLLSRISDATPKIAEYPFTTLAPQLGIADLDPRRRSLGGGRRLVVADIPGLIDNAHAGAGLGIRFLRHIERTRVLVHLVEPDPIDGTDPVDNYRSVRRELAAYSDKLAAKPQLVVLSKVDLCTNEQEILSIVQLLQEALAQQVFSVSAATGQGVGPLLETCWQRCERAVMSE